MKADLKTLSITRHILSVIVNACRKEINHIDAQFSAQAKYKQGWKDQTKTKK